MDIVERASGYTDAFFQLGNMLGIPSQIASPSEVWETQMKPQIAELIEAKATIEKHRAAVSLLREALEAIVAVGGEINPSNYNHEDVCALNNAFIEQFQIAEASIASIGEGL